jgi:hypothetical protein
MSNAGIGETIIGTLAIDYLTVVTPDIGAATRMFQLLTYGIEETMIGDPHASSYVSAHCGPFRLGSIPRQKQQNGRILSVHGAPAQIHAGHIGELVEPGHISRIDLQVTVPLDEPVDMHEIYHVVAHPDKFPWKQSGKPPYCSLFTNTDGGETVYIGKRTSDLMTRIYRKTIEGVDCLRWELEIKGRLARGLSEQGALYDPHVRATFARAVLAGYPDAIQHSLSMFEQCIEQPTGELMRHRSDSSDEATLLWFRRTVIPALKRAMKGKLREEVLDLLAENDWYLTNTEEWRRLESARRKLEAQKERKFRDLQEGTRTR